MLKDVNRISIIGGCGTGKTTLANNLGKLLNLSICHLDGLHHLKDWKIRDKSERDKMIIKKINEEKWIIDGTYPTTLDLRIERSDLVIYLDYSSIAQLKGVLGRFFKNHGKEKEEIPGCKERMTLEFFLYVLNWRKNKRPNILTYIKKVDNKKLLIFKSRRQLNKWYKSEFNKKIIIEKN